MSRNLTVSTFEIVGNSLCVASDDGQKVYDCIATALRNGQGVTLSFRNVSAITPTFLNTAIGQLYGAFSVELVRSLLKVQDLQIDDLALLKRVVDTAKLYFQEIYENEEAARKNKEKRLIEEPGKQ